MLMEVAPGTSPLVDTGEASDSSLEGQGAASALIGNGAACSGQRQPGGVAGGRPGEGIHARVPESKRSGEGSRPSRAGQLQYVVRSLHLALQRGGCGRIGLRKSVNRVLPNQRARCGFEAEADGQRRTIQNAPAAVINLVVDEQPKEARVWVGPVLGRPAGDADAQVVQGIVGSNKVGRGAVGLNASRSVVNRRRYGIGFA
nr:hypothetical protein [Tanacetum cinerariifolium]